MITEQDKAIERCNKLIETEHSNWIGITNQKAIETVLNMLKENSAEIHQKNTELAEKNAEIEKYKYLYQKALDNTISSDRENIKKDKMIDLMAKELQKHIFVLYDGDTITSKKGIIEHYERKVEK